MVGSEILFRCGRCGRRWRASSIHPSVPCICHQDCDYCGSEQTVTNVLERQNLGVKFQHEPSELDPHPWEALFQCTECGYFSSKVPVDAEPTDEIKFDQP